MRRNNKTGLGWGGNAAGKGAEQDFDELVRQNCNLDQGRAKA